MQKAEASKDDFRDKVEELKLKREDAHKKLEQLKEKTGDAWSDFKTGLDQAWADVTHAWEQLKAASEKASQRLK